MSPSAGGQSTGGRIRGTVSDPSGAAVVAAKVTLINEATNVSRDVDTGANGEYLLIEVPVGSYEIDVTQQGFKKYVRKGIALDLNQVDQRRHHLAARHHRGNRRSHRRASGCGHQLHAARRRRQRTRFHAAPPEPARRISIVAVAARCAVTARQRPFYGSDKAGVVTVNGGRGRANNYSVNGGDGNDLFANLPAIEPSPDSIEEFRVITNSFDAEYGRNSGAVVNVVTKSGTNAYHGSFYEFFRNDVLNAHPFTFFSAPKPEFRQNQFGGTLGGPIKKDKTFFFGSYEGRRIVQGDCVAADQRSFGSRGQRR